MTISDDILFCFKCGLINPEYKVNGYRRICTCGEPCVLTLTEAIDILNIQYERQGIKAIDEDLLDEDYDEEELQFE